MTWTEFDAKANRRGTSDLFVRANENGLHFSASVLQWLKTKGWARLLLLVDFETRQVALVGVPASSDRGYPIVFPDTSDGAARAQARIGCTALARELKLAKKRYPIAPDTLDDGREALAFTYAMKEGA